MRATGRLLVLMSSTALLGLVAAPAVTAGCAGPGISVPGAEVRYAPDQESRSVTVLPRGSGPLTVTGVSFSDGTCDDTPSTSGCRAPQTPAPSQPAQGVELRLTQGERTWPLGTADAGGSEGGYAVRWETELPADLRPGRATLTAGTADLSVEVPPA